MDFTPRKTKGMRLTRNECICGCVMLVVSIHCCSVFLWSEVDTLYDLVSINFCVTVFSKEIVLKHTGIVLILNFRSVSLSELCVCIMYAHIFFCYAE